MIPDEVKMVEKFRDKPFALIGINSDDEDRAVLKKMFIENSITWRNVMEGSTDGAITEKWNVHSWPMIYVLDASGTIRYKNITGKALRRAVEELLYEIEQ